jgi:uncharacterized protein YjbI with pentapeptide repeats
MSDVNLLPTKPYFLPSHTSRQAIELNPIRPLDLFHYRIMTFTPDRTTDTAAIIEQLRSGKAEGHDFRKVNLAGVDLSGCNLAGVKLIGANLTGANLAGANLTGIDLRGCDLAGADLSNANLADAGLPRANLCGAILTGANLEGTRLQLSRYDNATVWAEGFEFKKSGSIGPGAQLGGVFLNTVNLRGADLPRINALGAYLAGADLTGANLEGARLSSADLKRAYFTGAYLRDASLNNVDLISCDFRAADLTGVVMDNLQGIKGADFHQAVMSDELRARLLGRPADELDVRNSFTRRTTRESLRPS